MMNDKYNLSWDNFKTGASDTFKSLIDDTDFLDVTIACDDGSSVKAHKVILSSASSVLKKILTNNPHQHPLIYLKGMEQSHLLSILQFIYLGQVEIVQEELNGFMATAIELNIKGLNNMNQKDQQEIKKTDMENRDTLHKQDALKNDTKKMKHISDEDKIDVIEDVIKDEEITEFKTRYFPIAPTKNNAVEMSPNARRNVDNESDKFQIDIKRFVTEKRSICEQNPNFENQNVKQESCKSPRDYPKIKNDHAGVDLSRLKKFSCDQCEYRTHNMGHMKKHKLGIHEGVKYPCNYCGSRYTTPDNLRAHRNKMHGQTL